jgi:hypothetical protein
MSHSVNTHAGPSRQVLEAVEGIAELARQEPHEAQRYAHLAAVLLLLATVDYQPPPRIFVLWAELLHCLDRRQEAAEAGARHDETGIDWDARAAEALRELCGRPR